jgi:hypothetical protein
MLQEQSAYQEHVLDAPDVCSNCFRPIRRERSRTTSATGRSDVSVEKSAYTRVQKHTEVDHHPESTPTKSITVWCDCGTEGAYDRYWEDGDGRCLTKARFERFLARSIRALERKGVSLDRETCIRHALGHYASKHDYDAALKRGIEAGIQTAVASTAQDDPASASG